MRSHGVEVGHRRYMLPLEIAGSFSDRRVYAHPLVLPIVETLLGGSSVINSGGTVCALPDAVAQHIHLDHPPLFPESRISQLLPCYAITLFIPLVNCDERVGTTAVWLGSHRQASGARLDAFDQRDAFLPYLEIGSLYMLDYRVVHRGTANVGNVPRPICYIVYTRPWFTDVIKFQRHARLRITSAALTRVPADVRRLFASFTATPAAPLTQIAAPWH